MNPTVVGTIVFAFTFGGALLGFWLQKRRKHDLDHESTETIRHSIGVVATMTALILGLITASAKSSFDEVTFAVESSARDILTLDRLLARYGPETSELRAAFKDAVARRIDMVWPQGSSRPVQLDPSELSSDAEGLAERIRALTPRDDSQRWLQARAREVAEKMLKPGGWRPLTVKHQSQGFSCGFAVLADDHVRKLRVGGRDEIQRSSRSSFYAPYRLAAPCFSFWRWMDRSKACSGFPQIPCVCALNT